MKKIIAIAAFALTAMCAHAAATDWALTVGQMYGKDGKSTFTGKLELFASGGDLSSPVAIFSANPAAATYNKTAFSTDALTAGETYTFYLVLTDGDKALTSITKDSAAQGVGSATLNFGSMKNATQTASNWQTVPEPTSGLLLLLGMAGLALKRKRA